jgi:arabinofuranosyltransferase
MTEVIPFKKPALQSQLHEPLSSVLKKCQWQMLITIIASLVVHFLFFGDYYYTFDDSYVFHVYARNLANGYGFSFNPGEISHAATPMLTFVLAIQHFLFGGSALISAKIVNLGFSLSAAVLLFLIAYRMSGNEWIALGTAIVWAASPLEAILSAGPQDFALFTFLILLSVYFYLTRPKSLWTYFFLSLMVLTRYEGILLAGLLFLNHIYVEWKENDLSWKEILFRLLLLSFLPAIWFSYIGTHSTLFPSSGSAKLNPWILREIPHFVAGMIIFFFPPLILAALTAALATLRERTPHLIFLFVWVTFCLFFYGPFLDNRRYYVHLIPFIALFSLVYLTSVSKRYFESFHLAKFFLRGVLLLSFLSYVGTIPYYYEQTRGQYRETTYPAYKQAGVWIHQNTPSDKSIALEEIGVIPYFAERRVVDFSGWLDLKSKQFREKAEGINPQMMTYLSSKKPDYLIINTDFVSPQRQQMLDSDLRLKMIHKIPVLKNDDLIIYQCDWK